MKTRSTHSLSVVYATYNEESNMARSLESVKGLWDELIVVDGSSSDQTREIAKEYGARVIKTTNKPIFHINKQMAMDEAVGEWVLQMDADEVLDADMQAAVKKVLHANDTQSLPAAYWLKRKNWFLGRFLTKGGQYPDPVIRFYQRGKAYLPMESVHEQMAVEGEVGWLDGHLLHYSSPTFGDYLRKANTYTSLTAREWNEKKLALNFGSLLRWVFFQPLLTFFQLYFRHKGFMDGFAGFVFALFSGLHYPLAYVKYWELQHSPNTSPDSQ